MTRKKLVINTLLISLGILVLWLLHKLKGDTNPDSDWLSIIVFGLWIAALIGISIYAFIVRKRPMQEKEKQKWEKIRAKGKRRYVILGAIKVMFLLMLMNNRSVFEMIDKVNFFNITLLQAEVYALFGLVLLIIIIGVPIANWDDQEKKYKESLK